MCGNWKVKLFVFSCKCVETGKIIVKLFVFSCKCVETGKLNCLFSLVNVWKLES